jgi:TetR/AcrR family transcriptional repressor of uid operon
VRADSPYRRPDGHEQRSLATRRRIYEAALEEFRRVGFEAASIARIAVRAGVSRPSFYFHFATKQHVLLELQWVLEHEVVARIADRDAPDEALHAFVDELLRVRDRVGREDLFRDVLHNWVRPPEDVDWKEQPMPAVDAVRRRFEQAAEAGRLREGLSPERATVLFLTSVFGYLIGNAGDDALARPDLHALVDLYLAAA